MNARHVPSLLAVLVLAGCGIPERPSPIAQLDFQLTGYWAKDSGLEGASLLLSAPEGAAYPVRFSSSGCFGFEVLNRTAEFTSGFLILSEPVKEYSGTSYQRLALLQHSGRLILVPEPLLKEFQAAFSPGASKAKQPIALEVFAFTRLSTIP